MKLNEDNSFDFEIGFHIENKSTHCTYNLTGDLPTFCSGVAATRFRLVILNINHSKAILRSFCDMVSGEKSGKIELNEMAVIKPKSSTCRSYSKSVNFSIKCLQFIPMINF